MMEAFQALLRQTQQQQKLERRQEAEETKEECRWEREEAEEQQKGLILETQEQQKVLTLKSEGRQAEEQMRETDDIKELIQEQKHSQKQTTAKLGLLRGELDNQVTVESRLSDLHLSDIPYYPTSHRKKTQQKTH